MKQTSQMTAFRQKIPQVPPEEIKKAPSAHDILTRKNVSTVAMPPQKKPEEQKLSVVVGQ